MRVLVQFSDQIVASVLHARRIELDAARFVLEIPADAVDGRQVPDFLARLQAQAVTGPAGLVKRQADGQGVGERNFRRADLFDPHGIGTAGVGVRFFGPQDERGGKFELIRPFPSGEEDHPFGQQAADLARPPGAGGFGHVLVQGSDFVPQVTLELDLGFEGEIDDARQSQVRPGLGRGERRQNGQDQRQRKSGLPAHRGAPSEGDYSVGPARLSTAAGAPGLARGSTSAVKARPLTCPSAGQIYDEPIYYIVIKRPA